MASITCPTCGCVLHVDKKDGTAVLTFDMKRWQASCADQAGGDPALCTAVQPLILLVLQEPEVKSNGPGK